MDDTSRFINTKQVKECRCAFAKTKNKTIRMVKRIKAVKIGKVCENKYKLNERAIIIRLPQIVL